MIVVPANILGGRNTNKWHDLLKTAKNRGVGGRDAEGQSEGVYLSTIAIYWVIIMLYRRLGLECFQLI